MNRIDLTNKRSGRLIFLYPTNKRSKSNNIIWKCKCDCGSYKEIESRNFNYIKSCGCFHKEKVRKHNKSRNGNITYSSWCSMKQRCLNEKSKSYEDYGDKGIKICSRWLDKENGFINFLEDMGERPSKKHSIDRIDGIKGYYKENCRWATKKEQANNRKTTKLNDEDIINIKKMLEDGIYQKDISRKYGISIGYISQIKNRKRRK